MSISLDFGWASANQNTYLKNTKRKREAGKNGDDAIILNASFPVSKASLHNSIVPYSEGKKGGQTIAPDAVIVLLNT